LGDGPEERRDHVKIFESEPKTKITPKPRAKAASPSRKPAKLTAVPATGPKVTPKTPTGSPRAKGKLHLAAKGGVRVDGGAADEVKVFACTDTGNAERLAHRYGEVIRYIPAWGEHIVFEKGRWRRDTGDVVVGRYGKETVSHIPEEGINEDPKGKARFLKWQTNSYSRSGRAAMLALLKSEEGIALDHEELDTNPWLLSVQNGTIDLKTGKFMEGHNPRDYLTHVLPIKYNPKAKCPRWLKFLKEVMPDPEIRDFVHRFAGYCLTADVTERIFVVFHGDGLNGKSVFVKALESVMGKYAISAAPTLVTATEKEAHPTEVADLFRVRLASISETRKGSAFNEEKIKRLSGDDRLRARRMHEDHWEFEPTHKLLLLMNHKPRVRDTTNSFWDRCRIVPFNVRIKKADKMLKFKLREEREGILVWQLEGLKLWHEKGLGMPGAVEQATKEYREEEDVAGRFLLECCSFENKTAFTRTAALTKVNKAWTESLNIHYPTSTKELSEKLRLHGCTPDKEVIKDSEGELREHAGWRGVRLTKLLSYR
jgi:putative DNA primase/helicase